jgi:hypothetical protein
MKDAIILDELQKHLKEVVLSSTRIIEHREFCLELLIKIQIMKAPSVEQEAQSVAL